MGHYAKLLELIIAKLVILNQPKIRISLCIFHRMDLTMPSKRPKKSCKPEILGIMFEFSDSKDSNFIDFT